MNFDDFAMLPHQIAREAFEQGYIEGAAKVDKNVFNDGQAQGSNMGQLVGVIEGEADILCYLTDSEPVRAKVASLLQQMNELDFMDLQAAVVLVQIKAKLRTLKRQLQIKGGIEFKKIANIDF